MVSRYTNLLEQKKVFILEKESTPTRLVWNTNMAAVSYCSGTPCGGRDVTRKRPIGAYSALIPSLKFRHATTGSLPGRGGGGTPLSHIGTCRPRQRVGVLRCFGLKTGIDFAHFGLKSGMDFEGITGVLEFKKSFFRCSYLISNDDIIA